MQFLNEDELLLLIAKNNEEALGLLFLIYEKKMRFEAQQLKKNNTIYLDSEDIEQDFKIQFFKILANYDYTKGRFYSYWLSNLQYSLIKLFSRETKELVMFDSEKELEYLIFNNKEYDHLKYEELHTTLDDLKDKDKLIYQILIAWAQGFSYDEISLKFDLNRATINYHLKKGLDYLKRKMR